MLRMSERILDKLTNIFWTSYYFIMGFCLALYPVLILRLDGRYIIVICLMATFHYIFGLGDEEEHVEINR